MSRRAGLPRARRGSAESSGFTLVEIVVALAIVGLIAVVVLDKRIEVVRDAQRTRDQRLAWTLAAWKMGEIERDPTAFQEQGMTDSGGFEDLSADYDAYKWEYESLRELVATNDPENPDEKPKEIFRVKLKVARTQEEDKPLVELEGMFPAPAAQAEEKPESVPSEETK